jgi:hypothetical protein
MCTSQLCDEVRRWLVTTQLARAQAYRHFTRALVHHEKRVVAQRNVCSVPRLSCELGTPRLREQFELAVSSSIERETQRVAHERYHEQPAVLAELPQKELEFGGEP